MLNKTDNDLVIRQINGNRFNFRLLYRENPLPSHGKYI